VRAWFVVILMGWVGGCGGAEPAVENGGSESEAACSSDADCEERMADQCPGGSAVFAVCAEGECRFEGCSSPIGTPCDGDPATQFEDEECE